MKIDNLVLGNFRNFEQATFNFPTNFTVIIGENGKGKSTVLQGLKLAAGAFLLGIDESEKCHIKKEDVRRIDLGNRFVPQRNCYFEAKGSIAELPLTWKRTLSTVNGRTDTKDAAQIITIAKDYNDMINIDFTEAVGLPILCYFGTARLWAESKQTYKLKKKGSRLQDGYARCLDERSDKKSPMEWIKTSYWKKLKQKDESVLFDAVLEAIDLCIPNWKPTEWDEDSDDLGGVYTNDLGEEKFIPLFYLSDGLRTVASMVAEIAYRCVVLNGHLGANAVKGSHGVVLIDEIDMHLHPRWQQRVVNDLKIAFPNLQFVATTHSPFIVQSLKAEELINLDRWTDVNPDQLTINEVSTSVMGLNKEYGLENQRMESISAEYLTTLENESSNETTKDKLNTLEHEISDPAVRAFLSLQRLKNNL